MRDETVGDVSQIRKRTYDSPLRAAQTADTRRRIVEAAAAEFTRHGYAKTSVGGIASAAGVSRETVYNVLGGFLWVFSMLLAGYFLGGVVERAFGIRLEDHIEKVVVVVVALSLLPPVYEYLKSRREKARLKAAGDVQV